MHHKTAVHFYQYCVLADDSTERATYLKVYKEKIHYLGYGAYKLKFAHSVNYSSWILGQKWIAQ